MGKEKIAIVFCENLAWDEEKGETYCFLGKDHYPEGCGSICSDFKISEEQNNVRY